MIQPAKSGADQSERAHLTRVDMTGTGTFIDLLSARYSTHRFSPHWHEEYSLGVVESGAIRTRVGARVVTVPTGHLLALNPGDVHTGEPASPAGFAYRMVYLGTDAIRLLMSEGERLPRPSFKQPVIDDPSIAPRVRRALAALMGLDRNLAARDALVDAAGEVFLRYATEGVAAARMDPAIVGTVRDYLEAHHDRVVTLTELSALTRRSPFYISRTFRRALGVPPYTYLALVRVRRARELLAQGLPLSVVTHATGFSDQSHFIRQFKRVVGVTPGQYAREVARVPGRGGAGAFRLLPPQPVGRDAGNLPQRVSA